MKLATKLQGILIMGLLAGASAPQTHADSDVLIVGDSIMQAVSRSLERALNKEAGLNATSYTAIGSGLARLDLFDWHAQLATLMNERKPETVVIMMGANDNQPMRTENGIIRFGEPGWNEEYARRAGEAMDIMIRGGATAIYWIELPDMREERLQLDVTVINDVVKSEAEKRDEVTFQTSRGILSRKAGEYSPYIIQPNGMPLDIRSNDGVHLNRKGADHLVQALIKQIWAK
jgi:hypothetical protein